MSVKKFAAATVLVATSVLTGATGSILAVGSWVV